MESQLLEALDTVGDHPLVGEVRGGTGLLGAIEFARDALAERPGLVAEVFASARERGVILRPLGTGLAVSPPLAVTTEHLEQIAQALRHATRETDRRRARAPKANAEPASGPAG
jgi:putrescine---pyruvate transaminase